MKNVIIAFMGMDGSGKSTLSKYVCSELKKNEILTASEFEASG